MLYEVQIFYKNNQAKIKVILDTGNLLTDPITNTPVLIIEAQKLEAIIPQDILKNIDKILNNQVFSNLDEEVKRRCSIIPFSSLGKNNGMMIGFRPDYIKINTQGEEEIREKVIIGIYQNKITKNGVYSGLMGLNLLNNEFESKVMQ